MAEAAWTESMPMNEALLAASSFVARPDRNFPSQDERNGGLQKFSSLPFTPNMFSRNRDNKGLTFPGRLLGSSSLVSVTAPCSSSCGTPGFFMASFSSPARCLLLSASFYYWRRVWSTVPPEPSPLSSDLCRLCTVRTSSVCQIATLGFLVTTSRPPCVTDDE